MNIQTFLYNENFYEKLAFTLAIIRCTPMDFTPKEFVLHLQIIYQQKKTNEQIQYKKILNQLNSFRQIYSISISIQPLESYIYFLENLLKKSIEINIEIETIIIETIERIFYLIKLNLFQIQQLSYQKLFRQGINIIFNYDFILNIQKHTIEYVKQLLPLLLINMKKQINSIDKFQILIEQIGCHPSYFLLVFEIILTELLNYFDQSNYNSNYAFTLINILEKLTNISDNLILEQIINNDYVRKQYHTLLYRCLFMNRKDISLIIHLWNIYGRIV